jgi:hypothetical protein
LKAKIQHPKIVAIGEIGLDYFWDEPKDLQKRIFKEQLELAKELNMPVIIHDRDAHEDVIEILEEYQPKGVLHRYSGPVFWLIEEIIDDILPKTANAFFCQFVDVKDIAIGDKNYFVDEKIIDQFNATGCTSFQLSKEEIEKLFINLKDSI